MLTGWGRIGLRKVSHERLLWAQRGAGGAMHAQHEVQQQWESIESSFAPLTFSRVMRSMWMTHFFLYTCTIFPSLPCSRHRQ